MTVAVAAAAAFAVAAAVADQLDAGSSLRSGVLWSSEKCPLEWRLARNYEFVLLLSCNSLF